MLQVDKNWSHHYCAAHSKCFWLPCKLKIWCWICKNVVWQHIWVRTARQWVWINSSHSGIFDAMPMVRTVFKHILIFEAWTAMCKSSFSTLNNIFSLHRHSMLHKQKANLIQLAFERNLNRKFWAEWNGHLRRFNSSKNKTLQLIQIEVRWDFLCFNCKLLKAGCSWWVTYLYRVTGYITGIMMPWLNYTIMHLLISRMEYVHDIHYICGFVILQHTAGCCTARWI